jgi:NAD(P)-dependent dehydrogenase (short-subunit alcohol dehydrogenase family)
MTPRFERRVVLVTGAAGHIGQQCVETFRQEGARVGAVDLSEAPADASVIADVKDEREIERAFAEVEAQLGPIDVLVQSAAVIARVPYLEITGENIDRIFAVNVRAILLGGKVAARSMIDRAAGGAIVNLTSVSAVVSDAESVGYEASKGAVSMATKGMARALAPHGIRVNAVGPGSMTKFQERGEVRDPYDVDAYEHRRIPLARLGAPDDVARAVLFLAAPEASYITGTVLWVDGGSLAAW